MNKLLFLLATSAIITSATAQIGGGSATYGQGRASALEAARANELAKRNQFRDDTGRYLDAAILMNAEADEYVAVFSIQQEGKTLAEARQRMAAAIQNFGRELQTLKIPASDYAQDFIAQNRIYGYEVNGTLSKEVVVGFEIKKNFSIRYKDKNLLEKLLEAGAKAEIFDLVRVEYIVKDPSAIRTKLMAEAAKIIKQKQQAQEELLGVKIGQIQGAYPPQYSTYFPTELYDAYAAQEAEEVYDYRPNTTVQRARKARTFFYNGLTGKDFDAVINPVNTEPTIQFTLYVRVRY